MILRITIIGLLAGVIGTGLVELYLLYSKEMLTDI